MTTATIAGIISQRYPEAGTTMLSYLSTYPCPQLNPSPTRLKGMFSWYPGAWRETDARPCDDPECPHHAVTIDEIEEDANGVIALPSHHSPPGYVLCEFPLGDAHATRAQLNRQAPTVWHGYAGTTACLRPNLCPYCYEECTDEDDDTEEICSLCG